MGLFSREEPADGPYTAPKPVAYHFPRPLTASAARINLSDKSEMSQLRKRRESAKWQQDAWDYYDLIGELQFSANLVANVMSRIRLYPGYITSADTAPSNIFDVPDDKASQELKKAAVETLRKLSHGPGGIPGLLRDSALNLFIAGECYLTREKPPLGSLGPVEDVWQIRSVDEVVMKRGRGGADVVFLKSSRNDSDAELVEMGASSDVYFNRIWRNHPRFSADADSSLRPQLENCDQLLLYDRAKRSIVRSRLNNGLLFLPDGIAAAADQDGELTDAEGEVAPIAEPEDDAFEEELIDSMTEPIANEASASAVVPLIVRGPQDLGEKIRHITFERKFDPQITADHERLLERILNGLDLPKDVVAGVGSAKYANAVVIEESLYKAHIEPLVLTVVDALTVLLLRPVLSSLGFSDDEISRVTVWYDPSAITTKPDKATAATTGFELGTLSEEAWRRANGFSESDAPTGLEQIQRLAKSKGLLSEAVTERALRELYPKLFDDVRAASQEETDPETRSAVEDALDGTADGSFGQPTTQENTSADPADTGPTPPVELIEP